MAGLHLAHTITNSLQFRMFSPSHPAWSVAVVTIGPSSSCPTDSWPSFKNCPAGGGGFLLSMGVSPLGLRASLLSLLSCDLQLEEGLHAVRFFSGNRKVTMPPSACPHSLTSPFICSYMC